MRSHAGTPPRRRRFLSLVAGGAGIGTAVLNGCAAQVSSGVSGPGEIVTLMVKPDDKDFSQGSDYRAVHRPLRQARPHRTQDARRTGRLAGPLAAL
ncbi:hypothetical protein [Streptomyces sp. NPDC052127]|uniref:hypothetical protein n=1 Tax=Streptomyces sp. NPDC052127 TaxID=3155679 RepID=UPI003414AF0F